MNKDDKIIELLEYMIDCINQSNDNTLCSFEMDRMYEMLRSIKNS